MVNIESEEECDLGNNPDAWQLGAHEASTHISMQVRTTAPSLSPPASNALTPAARRRLPRLWCSWAARSASVVPPPP